MTATSTAVAGKRCKTAEAAEAVVIVFMPLFLGNF